MPEICWEHVARKKPMNANAKPPFPHSTYFFGFGSVLSPAELFARGPYKDL
jgi:hypothetical protein